MDDTKQTPRDNEQTTDGICQGENQPHDSQQLSETTTQPVAAGSKQQDGKDNNTDQRNEIPLTDRSDSNTSTNQSDDETSIEDDQDIWIPYTPVPVEMSSQEKLQRDEDGKDNNTDQRNEIPLTDRSDSNTSTNQSDDETSIGDGKDNNTDQRNEIPLTDRSDSNTSTNQSDDETSIGDDQDIWIPYTPVPVEMSSGEKLQRDEADKDIWHPHFENSAQCDMSRTFNSQLDSQVEESDRIGADPNQPEYMQTLSERKALLSSITGHAKQDVFGESDRICGDTNQPQDDQQLSETKATSRANGNAKKDVLEESDRICGDTNQPHDDQQLSEIKAMSTDKGNAKQIVHQQMSKVHEENGCYQKQKVQSKGDSRPVKDNVVLLLEKLGLRLYYPYKLSLMQVITIREVEKHKSFTDIPWIFLENIIMLNSNARDSLIEEYLMCDELHISSSDDADYTKKDLSNEIEIVNPLDLILLLFRCCSPILSQVIAMKMFLCRLAVPFIFRPYEFYESALIFLRHLQLIIIEQNTEKGSIQSSALKCPCHIVSFVRIGELSVSKSKIANQVLSDQYHDTFFHKDCPLGTSKRQVSNGLVEAAWDLINNESRNVTLYLNLRGDGLSWQGQLEILSKISSAIVIFLNIKHLHYPKSVEILNLLQSSVTGSVLAVDASSHTNADAKMQCHEYLKNIGDLRKQTRICKLAVGITFESYSHIKSEIKRSIIELLQLDKVLPVEERVVHAKTHLFLTDEDYRLSKRAEKMASEVIALIPKPFLNMREHMLPLQGRLWRNFTEKQKAKKQSIKYQSFYQRENLIGEMTQFREKQFHALGKQRPMMEKFQTILMDKNLADEECMMFITILQHSLNEQSRKVLPQFLQKYQKAWRDLKVARDANKSDVGHLQKEFKDAEYNLAEASFGLEHLVRECGQGFEAVHSCINKASAGMIYRANMLSKIFARLLLQGLPLELMDGDAANVPLSWIRAVLNEVKEIIGNKKWFAVSVIGIQSSGKSTLLNTMFGLQFAVSAGRCTRGVHIQLVPVDNKNFDYLLIADTEGLRAAELEHQKYDQDNKLATFAIGLGDVTIVNIKGENTPEVADILQIAVHAFLRLKLVNHDFNLEQRCVFVHQNVPATDAGDKMMRGRQKFEETLNEMTKEAAKQEKIPNIQFFNQVINFDSEKNVWYFSDMWVGDPPMAPTNPGYSKRASEVKQTIITKLSARRETFLTIDHTISRIEDLWKGILTDDFVFSFRNSLELKAYSILEKKYKELSWDLHKYFWEFSLNTAKFQLGNAIEEDELQKTANTLTNSLTPKASEKAKELEDDLNTFVEKHALKEVMLQWVKTKQLKLVILTDELLTSTKLEIITLKEELKIKILQIKEKANHEMEINRRARKLVSDLEGKQVEESIMKEQFENMWSDWFRNFETQIIQPLDTQSVTDKIKNTVWDMCPSITNYLNIEEISTNLTSLKGSLKPQNFEMGKHFEIHRPLGQNKPIHPGFYRQRVMEITDVIFNKIILKVSEIERQDLKFNIKFVVDILRIIEENIESHNNHNQSQSYKFNLLPLYNALIISHVVRYITYVFTKHEEAYQKRHSIMGQLEEYKDTAWGLFISAVNKTTTDITAAK